MEKSELEKRFTYHSPKGTQPDRYVTIREGGKALANIINELCPESREKAVAMTKLEEVTFWANASIARNE